jgi:predicted methyltransferase
VSLRYIENASPHSSRMEEIVETWLHFLFETLKNVVPKIPNFSILHDPPRFFVKAVASFRVLN